MDRPPDTFLHRNLSFLNSNQETSCKKDNEKFFFALRKKKKFDFIQMRRMKALEGNEVKKDSKDDDFCQILKNIKTFKDHYRILEEIRKLEEFVSEVKEFDYGTELKDEDIELLMKLFENNYLGSLSLILSIFTNLFVYSPEIIERFLRMNGMSLFINYLKCSRFKSNFSFVLDAISNIFMERPEMTQEFLTLELVNLLEMNLKSQCFELRKSTEAFLCHIFNYSKPVPKEISTVFIKTIDFLLESKNDDSNIYWVLYYLLKNSNDFSDSIYELNFLRVVLKQTGSQNDYFSIPCKRIIENLISSNFSMIRHLINLGLLEFILEILEKNEMVLIDFVVKIYSDLLFYDEFIHDALADDVLFCKFIEFMTSFNLSVRKEVIIAVNHLMEVKNYKIINKLINLDILSKIVNSLELKERDIIRLALMITFQLFDIINEICNYDQIDFYSSQFYDSGAVQMIHNFSFDANSEISKLARNLIESFFPLDDDEIRFSIDKSYRFS